MAEVKAQNQVERHLPHRLDQQAAAECIVLMKRHNCIDKRRAGGRKASVGEDLFGRVDREGGGLG